MAGLKRGSSVVASRMTTRQSVRVESARPKVHSLPGDVLGPGVVQEVAARR